MPSPDGPLALHATAVVVRASGILIRGASGAGKSTLALALLRQAPHVGWFARLIGDDRVFVEAVNGRVLVRPHPLIAGRIERRGIGILTLPHHESAVLRLIVDLVDASNGCDKVPRLPQEDDLKAQCCGIDLPRLTAPSATPAGETAAEIMRILLLDEGSG